ncbi:MAG: acetolactate synthase small subunit [Firmicutes bacterium]|nr:acetolactate synthase small subunit [Bacillota bacterium]
MNNYTIIGELNTIMSHSSHIIAALVRNHSGVLTRISGLFARRCYNIDSLSVCATEDAGLSRMTICASGDEATIVQIVKQLEKLPDTVKVTRLKGIDDITRELLLIKIQYSPSQKSDIENAVNSYNATIADRSASSAVIELTDEHDKIDAFISIMHKYGIIELVRTGLTAIERGKNKI